jgi:hypothetical protein
LPVTAPAAAAAARRADREPEGGKAAAGDALAPVTVLLEVELGLVNTRERDSGCEAAKAATGMDGTIPRDCDSTDAEPLAETEAVGPGSAVLGGVDTLRSGGTPTGVAGVDDALLRTGAVAEPATRTAAGVFCFFLCEPNGRGLRTGEPTGDMGAPFEDEDTVADEDIAAAPDSNIADIAAEPGL